ncbi:MAG: CerR family C-terminal domain-containing protein [Planctomycetota bacterium]
MPGPAVSPPSTRERLLEAAGEVFAAQGFAGATVRAICQRADANVAAVNYHFGDKESLYREALRYAFTQLHARVPTPAPDPTQSFAERLRAQTEALLERLLLAGESWHGRLIAREMADPSPALREVAERYFQPQVEQLERLLEETCPALSGPERRLHVLGLIAQCVFFRHARPVLDLLYGAAAFGRADLPLLSRHIAAQFLRGIGLDEVSA